MIEAIDTEKTISEIRKTVSDIFKLGKGLNIPAYQRGYRWSAVHVVQIIEDILEGYNNNEEFYCLQTLIVSEHEKEFHIIDGQQRLTTILIIVGALNYLSGIGNQVSTANLTLSLKYETRGDSEKFLHFLLSIPKKLANLSWSSIWGEYCNHLGEGCHDENIDFRFMVEAFIVSVKTLEVITMPYEKLFKYILNKCFFLWYPVDPSIKEEEQFYKVNMGKLSLTNSDLIKSEFMKPRISGDEAHDKRIALLAEKWHSIEKELRNPEFWAFIPHKNQYGIWSNREKSYEERNIYLPRIDEIFQLFITSLRDNSKTDTYAESDKYFLYNKLTQKMNEQLQNQNITIIWETIERLYLEIVDLYNADGRETLYHKYFETQKKSYKEGSLYNLVAYIIYSYSITLEKSENFVGEEILKIIETNRQERRSKIRGIIQSILEEITGLSSEELKKKDSFKEKLSSMKYEIDQKSEDEAHDERKDKNKKIKNLLMLFNFILLDKNSGLSNRYDFLNHRYWGIEHIFSQKESPISGNDELNGKRKEIERKLQELRTFENNEIENLDVQKFQHHDDLKSFVESKKTQLEEALEPNKKVISDNINRSLKNKIEKEKEKLKGKLNNYKKTISTERAFAMRKIVLESLCEYYDSVQQVKDSDSNGIERIKKVYGLTKHIDELGGCCKDFEWKQLVENDIIDAREDEILNEMIKRNTEETLSYDFFINKLFSNKNEKQRAVYRIKQAFGLEELHLYFDYIVLNEIADDIHTENYAGQTESSENSYAKVKEFVRKAAIRKFKEHHSDLNSEILQSIYISEVDNYFLHEHTELLKDNSLRNLSLLRSKENRILANNFIEKKEKVNEFLSRGTAIPYSTLLVFTDRYFEIDAVFSGERLQWLPSSRDKYFDDIVNNIHKFIFYGE
ncbi:DUF262 domain-containing protein [Paenibacillus glacialis]|uniref:GmrSD restriction endonucleases N-terminal domain-containing protein n=1 Tax=Paenibacillus glacialis TaxID=494026 RepID=A0A162PTC5_9BACL|nr:DUF262 domain-containing protein [Paenibacillus glacialis]OAB38900.1 hypothetical protein PGLA_19505 [Paenibacillus glacialis]